MSNSIFYNIFYKHRYITSLLIRYSIILITEFLYYNYGVLYTDIDYHVFSDGAHHILKKESPYERETYRYTPILAFMMTPNIFFWYPIGKFFLCTIDVCVGFLIENLIKIQSLNKKENDGNENLEKIKNLNSDSFGYSTLFYLYNPLTVVICTRGSADCIITFLVLLSLILLEKKKYFLSALIYGFSVHFKIYPIIYSAAIYLYLIYKEYDDDENLNCTNNKFYNLFLKTFQPIKMVFKNLFKFTPWMFIFTSAGIFLFFLGIFYKILGYQFLYEYLLYHVVRKDHRHNYSMFYYLIYLTYDSNLSKMLSYIAFLPQVILILFVTLYLYKHINLCLIILTMIFVAFNKVITAQYFIWYLSLLPLIIEKNKLFSTKKIKGIIMFSIWLFFEIIWNSYSHFLEYNGENKFLEMWIIDLGFFIINSYIIKETISNTQID
jgi:phosphatidylinositol glycan class M